MRQEHVPKLNVDLDEVNERSRKEIMKTIESYGLRPISDLEKMSDGDRTKWLFWNMHENLDALRKREPALIGQIIRQKPNATLGLATGSTPIGVYAELIRLHREEKPLP